MTVRPFRETLQEHAGGFRARPANRSAVSLATYKGTRIVVVATPKSRIKVTMNCENLLYTVLLVAAVGLASAGAPVPGPPSACSGGDCVVTASGGGEYYTGACFDDLCNNTEQAKSPLYAETEYYYQCVNEAFDDGCGWVCLYSQWFSKLQDSLSGYLEAGECEECVDNVDLSVGARRRLLQGEECTRNNTIACAWGEPHIITGTGEVIHFYNESDIVLFSAALRPNASVRVEVWARTKYYAGSGRSAIKGLVFAVIDDDRDRKDLMSIYREDGNFHIFFNCDDVEDFLFDGFWAINGETSETVFKEDTATYFMHHHHHAFIHKESTGSLLAIHFAGVYAIVTEMGADFMSICMQLAGLNADAYDGPLSIPSNFGILPYRSGSDPFDMGYFSFPDGRSDIFLSCIFSGTELELDAARPVSADPFENHSDVCLEAQLAPAEACCAASVNSTVDPLIYDACLIDYCIFDDCEIVEDIYGVLPTPSNSTSGGFVTLPASPTPPVPNYPDNWVVISGDPVDCTADASVCIPLDNTMCFTDGNGNTVCMCTAGSEVWNESTNNCDPA